MKTQTWLTKAEELYKSGMPYSKIADVVGHNRKTVSYHLRRIGYKSNPLYARKVDSSKLNRYDYSVTESIFEIVDTEEKAYWLGFLYADGYIDDNKHTVSLALKETDMATILKFRHFLGLDEKPVHKKMRKLNGKEFISYEFTASSPKLEHDLAKLGCVPDKTFKLKFPDDSIVPPNLKRHFVRGYFDGDGSVTHGGSNSSKITIEMIGTKNFIEEYQKWTRIPHKIYGFNHSGVSRSMYGGANAIVILDRLYKDATVFLERKHETYIRLRRLAVTSSKRTARQLEGKIGEGLAADTEVTMALGA